MPNEQYVRQSLPTGVVDPPVVPKRFLGNVGVPNQQELTETDVAPKHNEAKHHLAHIVIMLSGDLIGHPSGALKPDRS